VPATKEAMLRELGLDSVEEIYAEIPDRLRFKGRLDIPEPILGRMRPATPREGPARPQHELRGEP